MKKGRDKLILKKERIFDAHDFDSFKGFIGVMLGVLALLSIIIVVMVIYFPERIIENSSQFAITYLAFLSFTEVFLILFRIFSVETRWVEV